MVHNRLLEAFGGREGLGLPRTSLRYSVVTCRRFSPIFDWCSKMTKFLLSSVFPNLTRIVETQVPAVAKNKQKFDAFMKFGQFSESDAELMLLSGFGPELVVRNHYASWGHYPGAGNQIWISEWLAEQYEKVIESWHNAEDLGQVGSGEHARWMKLVKHAILVVESTILHEMVHWGDVRADGITRDSDAERLGWADIGHMFVKAAYGDAFSYQKQKLSRLRVQNIEFEGWIGLDYRYMLPFDPWYGLDVVFGRVKAPR